MTTRHEFLAQLHSLLKPRRYLEVGVQYGTSLNLAIHSETAIGIDPLPLCEPHGNQQIFSVTADEFFQYYMAPDDWIDLAFIDGSHLVEDALRDFINIELHSHENTIVVLDDVLPTTQEMTSRIMIPGHWTGDVWKMHPILLRYRPDLKCSLVDTEPTGTMVVSNLDRKNVILPMMYSQIIDEFLDVNQVPGPIIDRKWALPVSTVLANLKGGNG